MPVTADVDLYACLGCRRSAYQLDLRRAFRAVSLRYHPRRGGGESRARFEAACNAWEVLGNEDVEDLYDRYGLSGLSWDRPSHVRTAGAGLVALFRGATSTVNDQ
ncbi:Chaperone protein DnaJ [Diplonema papillatum]|nr:Chaperone protein DnaJ [Diplonema papillatum]